MHLNKYYQKYSLFILAALLFWTASSLFEGARANAAVLSCGARNPQVVALQQALTEQGFHTGTIDGIYGPSTRRAVIRFQQARGLKADGIAGPRTAEALGISADNFSSYINETKNSHTLWVTATGYCPCAVCNYPYGGQPSYLGLPLTYGIAAVDPRIIPMGASLDVPGYGKALAADQGNAIIGNRIDLCFPTHQEALNWGIQKIPITVYE